MAARFTVKSGTFALTAGVKTIINLIAGTRELVIVEFSISFDGVTASAVPALVEIGYGTQATAGTPGSSPTPVAANNGAAAVATAGIAYSAEPTAQTSIKEWFLTPNGGLLLVQSPLGREPITNTSASGNKAFFLRANVSAAVNCRAYIEFEE